MRDFFDKHARNAKPDAAELDKRNRESGISSLLPIYEDDPDINQVAEKAGWLSFEGGVPGIKAKIDGVLYSVAFSVSGPSVTPGSTWTPITFTGSWTNVGSPYETAAYSKDASGIVRLRGAANYPSSFTAIATLPAGYRPAGRVDFAIAVPALSAAATIYVDSDGVLNFNGSSPGIGGDVPLNAIWFVAA